MRQFSGVDGCGRADEKPVAGTAMGLIRMRKRLSC